MLLFLQLANPELMRLESVLGTFWGRFGDVLGTGEPVLVAKSHKNSRGDRIRTCDLYTPSVAR